MVGYAIEQYLGFVIKKMFFFIIGVIFKRGINDR